MTSREQQYLLDILLAAEQARLFVAGRPDSVLHDDRKMSDLRNVIVHECEGVDLSRIWRVVDHELPVVIAALAPLFPERPQ